MKVKLAFLTHVGLAWALPGGAFAQAPAVPADACRQGYVWREAFAGDHVCVVPSVRAQAAEDNGLANMRRSASDRSYGPDTCQPGFVWREAQPGDHVCVPSETRAQAVADNAAAPHRVARPLGQIKMASTLPAGAMAQIPVHVVQPPVHLPSPPPPAAAGAAVRRGFDEDGSPYVEETMADGSRRRSERGGVRVIHPDETEQFYPNQYVYSNAPPPVPPELPSDPVQGRLWVERHNEALLELIQALVNRDPAEMDKFTRGEQATAGEDTFAQIVYRTKIASFLAVQR